MGDHPLPFLLHRFVPRYLPRRAAPSPPASAHVLPLRRPLHAGGDLALSGYTAVVPGILMGGITRRTAIHYATPAGNYGAWGMLDWIHGTSLGKDVMADVCDEAEKHQVKERGIEAASGLGRCGARKK